MNKFLDAVMRQRQEEQAHEAKFKRTPRCLSCKKELRRGDMVCDACGNRLPRQQLYALMGLSIPVNYNKGGCR